jgi:hypothetical protein
MASEQRQQQRLQGCERSSATGSRAVAQSNEIGLTVIRETSREWEVETNNETQQTRKRREKIVCYTILAAQTRPRNHGRSSNEDRKSQRRTLLVVQQQQTDRRAPVARMSKVAQRARGHGSEAES